MKIDFDLEKSRRNAQVRGLPFDRVSDLEWDTFIFQEDTRYVYPERRFVGAALLEDRLHILCFTPIVEGIRVISFRKANAREVRYYEKTSFNR